MRCPALLRLSGDPWNVNAERLTAHEPRSCTYSAHRQRPDRDPVTRPFQYFWVPVPRGTHEYPFAQAGVGFVACHRRSLTNNALYRAPGHEGSPPQMPRVHTHHRWVFLPHPLPPHPRPHPRQAALCFLRTFPKGSKTCQASALQSKSTCRACSRQHFDSC